MIGWAVVLLLIVRFETRALRRHRPALEMAREIRPTMVVERNVGMSIERNRDGKAV